jgi:hypothetical protein
VSAPLSLWISESSPGGLSVAPQTDRRAVEERRNHWRGGRRVSDFSRFVSGPKAGLRDEARTLDESRVESVVRWA